MIGVQVQVVRFLSDSFPGFVECALIDAHGRLWSFVEKGPVVTSEYLTATDEYPQPGVIACEVVGRAGPIVYIDTELPWGVESEEGETRFAVFEEQLVSLESAPPNIGPQHPLEES
jgi:hypothetical protein